jgi:hypothetical protein
MMVGSMRPWESARRKQVGQSSDSKGRMDQMGTIAKKDEETVKSALLVARLCRIEPMS